MSSWERGLRPFWNSRASTGWDHWLRKTQLAQSKECLFPEVPRTKHVSSYGTTVTGSMVAFFEQYAFAQRPAGLKFPNLGDLHVSGYDAQLAQLLANARVAASTEDALSSRSSSSSSTATVLPYSSGQWPSIAGQMQLMSTGPRGYHKGMILLKVPGSQQPLILADRRLCPYLPESERLIPHPGLTPIAAETAESCDHACAKKQLVCRARDLPFLNTCSALQKAFPCQRGCGSETGSEIPCYVTDAGLATYQYCLVTDLPEADCAAAHRSTARLCACVPP